MPFTARIKVRFADVDNAGVVYYPRYFDYVHVAFEDLFGEHFGRPYAEVLGQERVGFPSVHAEADFRAPLRFGDVAAITPSVARIGDKSVDFVYEIRKGDGGPLCATARITIVTIDMDTFAGIPVPERYRELFRGLQATGAGGTA